MSRSIIYLGMDVHKDSVTIALQRALTAWGIACDVIAPSLIPKRPGVQRKHDKYDAGQLARLSRAGELTVVRIPSEAEERVRDVVRCRETFQRELMKSRHYVPKFLAQRGVVYREGKPWSQAHLDWLRSRQAGHHAAWHDTNTVLPVERLRVAGEVNWIGCITALETLELQSSMTTSRVRTNVLDPPPGAGPELHPYIPTTSEHPG